MSALRAPTRIASALPAGRQAHLEAFAQVRPAASLLEVKSLADPEMLVEIEAVAVI